MVGCIHVLDRENRSIDVRRQVRSFQERAPEDLQRSSSLPAKHTPSCNASGNHGTPCWFEKSATNPTVVGNRISVIMVGEVQLVKATPQTSKLDTLHKSFPMASPSVRLEY